jgi:hypothetical protein
MEERRTLPRPGPTQELEVAKPPKYRELEARAVAKYHSRPSAQYRYEHYDPWFSA